MWARGHSMAASRGRSCLELARRIATGSSMRAPALSAPSRAAATAQRSRTQKTKAAAALVENPQEVTFCRRALERRAVAFDVTVAGVTFDGRQERIAALQRHQKLMLLAEPSNPHDPNAVKVLTLSGQDLGYVPKEHTEPMLGQGILAGQVLSAGQNKENIWGAIVTVQPGLLPCMVEPFPKSLADSAASQLVQWTGPRSAQLLGAHQACEVSGVTGEASGARKLEVVPLWRYDEVQKKVQLVRLAVVTAAVAKAKQVHRMEPGSREYEEAVRMIRNINKWSAEEVQEHVQWALAKEAEMERGQWQVDNVMPA